MEDILELIGEVILKAISVSKFRNPKTRTWVITVFWLIAGGILVGLLAYNAWPFLVRPATVGDCVICGLVALVTVAWLVFVILGHRKNWPSKWL